MSIDCGDFRDINSVQDAELAACLASLAKCLELFVRYGGEFHSQSGMFFFSSIDKASFMTTILVSRCFGCRFVTWLLPLSKNVKLIEPIVSMIPMNTFQLFVSNHPKSVNGEGLYIRQIQGVRFKLRTNSSSSTLSSSVKLIKTIPIVIEYVASCQVCFSHPSLIDPTLQPPFGNIGCSDSSQQDDAIFIRWNFNGT